MEKRKHRRKISKVFDILAPAFASFLFNFELPLCLRLRLCRICETGSRARAIESYAHSELLVR